MTDYGNGATSAKAAADDKMDVSTESGSVAPTEQTESSGAHPGHTLSEWLGGTEFEWKSTSSFRPGRWTFWPAAATSTSEGYS